MLFDEATRAKLIDVYRKLPEEERTAYRALAVVFVPVNVTALTPILNAAMETVNLRRKWNAHQYTTMLEKWKRAGLAEKCVELRGEGWACSKLTTEVAAREALDRSEFRTFDAAAEQTSKYQNSA